MEPNPAASEVESTVISRIAYEPRRGILSVWFRETGACYRYFGVPPAVYRAFAGAASKGRFFNLHIRDRYDFCRKAA
ncbi:MAG: KTSC domain-containing protein [Rhizobiales bacterium]|nr:KTSC domain-containing protein [Hyphomicrobiales bacterium]